MGEIPRNKAENEAGLSNPNPEYRNKFE